MERRALAIRDMGLHALDMNTKTEDIARPNIIPAKTSTGQCTPRYSLERLTNRMIAIPSL